MAKNRTATAVIRTHQYSIGDQTTMNYAPLDSPPSIPEDDIDEIFEPHRTLPRLNELKDWLSVATKNNLWYLFWKTPLARRLVMQITAMCIGDGIKVYVYKDQISEQEGEGEIDWEATNTLRAWFPVMCGENQGIYNHMLLWLFIDNWVYGQSLWYKHVADETAPTEWQGKLTMRRLDPRQIVIIWHDYNPYFRKYTQYPIVQTGFFGRESTPLQADRNSKKWKQTMSSLPDTEKEFMAWHPAHRGIWMNISSPGRVLWDRPRDIRWQKVARFNLFVKPPAASVIDELQTKKSMIYYIQVGNQKYAFPLLGIKVPRHATRDRDDDDYRDTLGSAAQVGADVRIADCIAYVGPEFDEDGKELSPGWEINVIETQKAMKDFSKDIAIIDQEISRGFFVNLAMVSGDAGQGSARKMAGAHSETESQIAIVKMLRVRITETLKEIFAAYLFHETDTICEIQKIKVNWTQQRESDVAVYGQVISMMVAQKIITIAEAREILMSLGINLSDISDEELIKNWELWADLDTGGGEGGRSPGSADENPGNTGDRKSGYTDSPEDGGTKQSKNRRTGGGGSARSGN